MSDSSSLPRVSILIIAVVQGVLLFALYRAFDTYRSIVAMRFVSAKWWLVWLLSWRCWQFTQGGRRSRLTNSRYLACLLRSFAASRWPASKH
jgi:hypothetical protein